MEPKDRVPDDLADLESTPAAPEPAGRHHAPLAEETGDPRTDPAPVPVGALTAQGTTGQNGHGVYSGTVTAQSSLPGSRYAGTGEESGSFHGRITREDGRPVPSAALTLIDQRGHEVARAAGLRRRRLCDQRARAGQRTPIDLRPGHRPDGFNVAHAAQSQRTDLTLSGLGELSGTVRSARGRCTAGRCDSDRHRPVRRGGRGGRIRRGRCVSVPRGGPGDLHPGGGRRAYAPDRDGTHRALQWPVASRYRTRPDGCADRIGPRGRRPGRGRYPDHRPRCHRRCHRHRTHRRGTGRYTVCSARARARAPRPIYPKGSTRSWPGAILPVTGQISISGEEVGYDVELGYGTDGQA